MEAAEGSYVPTDAGYAVTGRKRPAPPADARPVDASDDLQLLEVIAVRSGTKLAALVIALRGTAAVASERDPHRGLREGGAGTLPEPAVVSAEPAAYGLGGTARNRGHV